MLKATPLHCAAEVGNSAQLEVLLKLGIDANGENAYGDTPLLVACANNQAECVKLLLEHNADPTKANHKKQNALHMAVAGLGKALRSEEGKENENVEEKLLVAKRLLEDPKVPLAKRIDPNHADANGQTPLHHIAVMKERPATVALAKSAVGFRWESKGHGCERKTALGARRGPGDAARGSDGSAEAPRAVGVGLLVWSGRLSTVTIHEYNQSRLRAPTGLVQVGGTRRDHRGRPGRAHCARPTPSSVAAPFSSACRRSSACPRSPRRRRGRRRRRTSRRSS